MKKVILIVFCTVTLLLVGVGLTVDAPQLVNEHHPLLMPQQAFYQ